MYVEMDIPHLELYKPEVPSIYITLLQLGLETVKYSHKESQTDVITEDATTQTDSIMGILWGYF